MTSRDRLTWRTSSYSGTNGGQCVEIAFDPATQRVLMRDTKFQRTAAGDGADQPVIEIPDSDWPAFLASATTPTSGIARKTPSIEPHPSGDVTVRGADGTTLTFTAGEWTAFTSGVSDGEFTAA
ncbi:DUF397 domain-containing protein [Nocardia vulneris]|uniref:DUF397 domain-containing protein n=1 Tax=Nocardia vulneris TaxID=1141657 RepID=UPI0009E25672|nr:DUF397 domain-containing protein [Nocardia vulneris]